MLCIFERLLGSCVWLTTGLDSLTESFLSLTNVYDVRRCLAVVVVELSISVDRPPSPVFSCRPESCRVSPVVKGSIC
jgi:hypothetical protein